MTEPASAHNQVEFVPSFDDVLAAYRLSLPSNWKAYSIGAVLVVAGIAALFSSVVVLPSGPYSHLVGEVSVGCIAGGAWFLGCIFVSRAILFKRKIRRIYKQQVGFRDRHDFQWSETGLAVSSPVGSATLPWNRFTKFKEDAAAFLLYQSDALFFFVPKRYLSAEQIDSLRSHITPVNG